MTYEKKAENMFSLLKTILYYCNKSSQKLYKTKLNKLLFYTQFLHYKNHDEQLLNGNFICDHYGPVLENLDEYLSLFERAGFISLKNTRYGKVIESNVAIDKKDYSDKERKTMQKVLNKFDNYTSREISDYSHEESLWENTELKDVIDIERAYELNVF